MAAANDGGLFGAADPTYDGAFRQGLAMAAVQGSGTPIPATATNWLAGQQCADGGWTSYRADISVLCPATDLATYTGEDTNSTALAVIGLLAAGDTERAARGVAWLRSVQNADGGFGYLTGNATDANSTGLVVAALVKAGIDPNTVRQGTHSPTAALGALQLGCSAAVAEQGLLEFQPGSGANNLATVQGALGLAAGTLPVSDGTATTVPTCPAGASNRAAHSAWAASALTHLMAANAGAVPSDFGAGPDLSSTAWAVISLHAAGFGGTESALGLGVLGSHLSEFVLDPAGAVRPAAAALAILAVRAEAGDPATFGGQNLYALLLSSVRPMPVSPSPTSSSARPTTSAPHPSSHSATITPTVSGTAAGGQTPGSTTSTTTSTSAAAGPGLPRTGAGSSGLLGTVGAGLLLMGSLLVLVGRRPRGAPVRRLPRGTH